MPRTAARATGPSGANGAPGIGIGKGNSNDFGTDPFLNATPVAIVQSSITLPEAGLVVAMGDAELYKDAAAVGSVRGTCQLQLLNSTTGNWDTMGQPVREDISTPTHHRQLATVGSSTKGAGTYSVRIACWSDRTDNALKADRGNLVLLGVQSSA